MTEVVATPKTPAAPVVPVQPAAQPVVVTTPVVQPAVVAQPDLQAVATALLTDVPEHLRGLIPNIEPAAQIEWFTKAKTAGAFSTGTPAVPQTDSGKPTVTPVETNLNDLPIAARMASGYGQ